MSWLIAFVSLALGLIGVVGETTDKDKEFPARIKPWGYLVIVLMLIGFAANWAVLVQASKNRDIVAQTAYSELRSATFQMLSTYFVYTDPPWADRDSFDFDRPVEAYSNLADGSSILSVICDLDYRQAYDRTERPVAYVFSESMTTYRERIGEIINQYQSHLPNSLLVKLSRLTTHPWVEFNITLERRFNMRLADQSPLEYMRSIDLNSPRSKRISCGDDGDRAHFMAMSSRFNQLLLDIEAQTLGETARIQRRGIPPEETPLFVDRPFWFP